MLSKSALLGYDTMLIKSYVYYLIMSVSVEQIDHILPQTQCTKCGYDDCLSYAKAIQRGTPHNQCPPGGIAGIKELSTLLNREIMPLNPKHGVEASKKVAFIHEDLCIGCKKCIQACPVDAIIGSGKLMHTVITDECTGCDLCVEPCPMDCIELIELPANLQPEKMSPEVMTQQKDHYRNRHTINLQRLNQQHQERHQEIQSQKQTALDKKAYIAEALANFRAKKKEI